MQKKNIVTSQVDGLVWIHILSTIQCSSQQNPHINDGLQSPAGAVPNEEEELDNFQKSAF